MAKSYPPHEPPFNDIVNELNKRNIQGDLIKKIAEIYELGELPDDVKLLNKSIGDTRDVVHRLCGQ
jgi:hypothetical protein